MNIRAALHGLLSLAAVLFSAASGHAAPRNLLGDSGQWRVQGGDWKVDAVNANAKVAAADTVSELAAARGLPLVGRWMSVKCAVTGELAKAGVWFSGLRDEKGRMVRVVMDVAAGGVTDGYGKTLIELPAGAFSGAVEVILTFSGEKLVITCGEAKAVEVAVKFDELTPTPSLFAERGAVEFREVILAGDRAEVAAAPMLAKVPEIEKPKAAKEPPPVVPAAPRVVVDFSGAGMHAMKSGWNDYFGVHVDTAPGPWRTIRQYDGPEFGMPYDDRHSGDVKSFDGPFAKQPLQVSLGDFGDWKRKDAKRLDSHFKELGDGKKTAVFIAPWMQPFDFIQQDKVWALMKALYGGDVGAEQRVFFQWGSDINSARLGSALNAKIRSAKPRGSASARGANKDEDIRAYVEHYFAPAVEAVRMASEEIYKEQNRIPVLLGSCGRASDAENREWYTRVLETRIEGSLAQSLKGIKVAELVSYITVDYPFYRATDAAALQELWDRYGRQVKGLWVTEEYGSSGKGTTALLQTAALYIDWAARNELDADQTRLLWNIPEGKKDKYGAGKLVRTLGETLAGPLRAGMQKAGEATLFRIASGDGSMLVVNVPPENNKGKKPDDIAELAIPLNEAQAAKQWSARLLSTKDRKAPEGGRLVEAVRDGANLVVKLGASPREDWAVIVEAR